MLAAAGLLVLAVGAGVHFGGPPLARAVASAWLRDLTGFGVELAGVDVDFGAQRIEWTGLRLMNPPPFEPGEAVYLPRVSVDAHPAAFRSRRPWFERIEIDLQRMTVVQPVSGPSNAHQLAANLDAWLAVRSGPERATAAPRVFAGPVPESAAAPGRPAEDIRIDELWIRIGRLRVIDHRFGGPQPFVVEHALDREATYREVRDLTELSNRIAVELAVGRLMDELGRTLGETPSEAVQRVDEWLRGFRAPPDAGQSIPPVEDPATLFGDILGAPDE